ncbi:MAG: hypothetical protein ACJ8DI_18685, partial [Ktedonobacteraceae bacterium]
MTTAEFDEFVLTCMPTFVAINYQRLLEAQDPQEQVTLILHIYNLGLRALTINLVSQYIFRDRAQGQMSDPYLDTLLEQRFPHLTADAWEEMLFTTLRAYEGHRDLFFMPQLYDFYWAPSTHHHSGRAEVKPPFDRLTQATLEHQTQRLLPQDASGWQVLATELLAHLRKILESLSFISEYDLIHVLTQDEHTYTFKLHKGTRILTQQKSLKKAIHLTTGWFYLRASTEDFLPLHPLLVFWEDTTEPPDTGVFDRRIHEQLRYLLATSGQTRLDEKRVRDFVKLIYLTIQEAAEEQKQAKQKAETLTWVQLCDICKDITEHRLATVRGKYHRDLYLQRDTARQHVEAFLADRAKRGFVLVGKSGVGKSNFLLALAEGLQQSRDDVCVLMYDGANLPIASSSFTEIISQDFSDQVLLSRQPVHQVWQEIAKIEGIDERQVIVCVDAINENPQASELLRHLDALVQSRWRWLKVVLSSRPETWKEIKRSVKLAEALYYRGPGTEVVGIELEPFSYSEQMEPFSRQELPEVYSKYQQSFDLQTSYRALTHELREMLRDPLNLWLIASTYRGKDIPSQVKTSALIEQYVNTILQREERRFVEQQLVPLMVREGHSSNMITEAELDAAGGGLYELVYSKQVLSDGQRLNQSFLQLSDADILVLQKQGFEQRIAFKYERFYEYFAGKRILSLSETQSDRYAFFLGLIEQTTHTPFLWGAVRNALIEETKKHGPKMVQRLCYTEHQRVKEMMVSVFVMLGMDGPEQIEGILKNLVPQEKQSTEWRKGRQLVRKTPEALDVPSRNAGRIAVEVASTLGMAWVLQRAALQEDQSLRTAAVRYSYHLWQHNQAQGFEILEHLAQQAVSGFLPNLVAFEAAFGLSLTIFFDHSRDEAVLRRLQSSWRGMIAKLLGLRESAGRWESILRTRIRESLFSLVITLGFRILREHPWYSMVNYQSFDAFFQLGVAEKALYKRLVHYLDVQGSYSREQMENDFLTAITMSDILIYLVTVTGLIAHGHAAPLAFLPFLKRLHEAAKSDVRSYPYLADLADNLQILLLRDPTIDEVFDFYIYAVEVCHKYYAEYPQTLRSSSYGAAEALYLGPYIYLQYQRTGSVRSAWLETRLQAALSRNDEAFFKPLFTQELTLIGIERQKPRIALDALASFFKDVMQTPTESNHEIRKLMLAFLARLRLYYPDEVDDFLEEQQAPHDFRLQVQTNEPIETMGVLVG